MTSSGKVRIYELSKDLGLENKDVLDAAEKLSIPEEDALAALERELMR